MTLPDANRQDLRTMPETRKRSFTLPSQQAEYIDAKVASGAYASASDVVRAGLRALQERDAAIERWLANEVAPVYDAMKADPSRAIPAETVFSNLRKRGAVDVKRGS
jgi:antitoxin ParD1/3/4